MGKSILVTGGARSGKSAIAEGLALKLPGRPVYIATAEARDGEMSERILRHRARRGDEWRTVEEPLDLVGVLQATDGDGARLVDCLTLWLSNLMEAGQDPVAEGEALARALAAQRAPVILVTNEVGSGIVPDNALGRAFRDAAGELNQMIARASDDVYLAVSGCPLKVK
ncbi:bifunctional adenosylcobinamide kinase/adenosylcobinamide-phosphate guanylyltransferase [Silicimonas algicola]|uniref:Bifunctional adenosylcobalamin biosynthesis protein n=1 Tax=Silicimonas algicola TaxID=1826607 RepID=A0A316G7M8_9RHOB|nr:bifunctional adenosylcobinamide kinase/adenosylcobinamide-phosphate guanylyltransferase [Silicimonas algicola]AZQ67290.1 bifunctional adenosylcobinamide kinase/adenosylcobinamide-phosphate guanylyltransferase [Silicimonas algicola]PWK56961.1 adenosylcobinamide kinase /adenosylcobinamide-phosphate guanylyltransferase [Silicimonas algicola]